MHPTTLLAYSGLAPLHTPARPPRASTAPRRRALRAAPRPLIARTAGRRPALPSPLGAAFSGWQGAVIALVIALLVGGVGILRVWPPFAVVMSGSMAPTINTGDMVVLERLHAPARIGQIVAVDVPDAARARYGYPPVVIHRVFAITPDGQIRTKGDARPQPDPFTIPRTAVDTRVIARIPSGGRVLAFFQSAPGLLWLAFGGLLFFGLPLFDRQRDARRQEVEATADLRGRLAAVTEELGRLHADQERSRATADATLSQLDRLARLVELACVTGPAPAVLPLEGTPEAPHAPRPAADATAADPDAPVVAPPEADAAPTVVAVACPSASVPAIPTADAVPSPAETPVPAPASPVLFALPPRAARPIPLPSGRWDAAPSGASACGGGWDAAPATVATRRFSRTGRLVAASRA